MCDPDAGRMPSIRPASHRRHQTDATSIPAVRCLGIPALSGPAPAGTNQHGDGGNTENARSYP